MTTLSLTSILDVSMLLEEVKMSCFVSKSACVNPPPPPPVEEIVSLVIVIFSPAIKVFFFVFKAVSTYNFEVKCVVKVGVVFLANTLSAFKSPTIVCNPVKLFAEFNFAVVSNVVCNPSRVSFTFVVSPVN
jgi:hypothetical protein